ncbi:MAG: deoxyribodipyrimidine photo-lyase, partial [Desulfobacteraceae bacterium]|nr:deoxyribodipyrimidine photo-lyase [Desulfobacteraceae bacterium]
MSIHPARIRRLNDTPVRKGPYVLYWMQQSQRAAWNHALEYAIDQANEYNLPLVVGFGLTHAWPEANLRHYTFMLEGLAETGRALADRGIQFVVQKGLPPDVALDLGDQAALIVCDTGYLRHQRQWRQQVAQNARCPVIQVETDVVVPVAAASNKAEYAARTIRPKLHRVLADFLMPLSPRDVKNPSLNRSFIGRETGTEGLDVQAPNTLLPTLSLDKSVPPVSRFFAGGTSHAKKRFQSFLANGLEHYDQNSNQPQTDDISHMSPYLHFGQISPLYLAMAVMNADRSLADARDAFMEQLIIRRELAVNFVYYTPDYDQFDVIPGWAKKTLADHETDPREFIYTADELA